MNLARQAGLQVVLWLALGGGRSLPQIWQRSGLLVTAVPVVDVRISVPLAIGSSAKTPRLLFAALERSDATKLGRTEHLNPVALFISRSSSLTVASARSSIVVGIQGYCLLSTLPFSTASSRSLSSIPNLAA